tara:strand:- start:167 stop:1564 length:1398 start_codon:yes stop_codon:yes gene_type:complete
MADLEKNLEQAIEEAMQPDSKAEKGDSKPVKQGSSDAAKIESGKGEVVKPEENPVDKAVASVKSAEKGTKEVSGDAQQKGEAPAEPQVKLKKVSEEEDSEDEKPSKMEMIKAMVNNMKGMDKEKLMAMYKEMSHEDDEMDESLTKAEIARNIVELMKKKDDDEVEEGYLKSMKMDDKKLKEEEDSEDEDEKEDEDEDQKEMMMKKSKKEEVEVESDLVEMEVEDDLEKISEALELSEENQEKARTIFKAAVSSKVSEIKEQLESDFEENLKTSVEQVKGDLAEAVDKYLTYCAEEWTKENELAIERGLRSEMTENFIEGLKTLFVEHYVDVPEDKYDVIDELANRLDEMEEKLDNEVHKNMEIVEENDSLKRQNVVREACLDLSESQQEKMVSLSEGVDFVDQEDFAEKVSELKEAYFPTSDSDTISEETVVEEGTGDFASDEETVLSGDIARYSEAISKLKPLG